MKWILILWGGPVLFLASWYTLSYNDISFGMFMLSREANDLVFEIYGNVLGIDRTIPPLVARALVLDSVIVFGLLALRRRKSILARYRRGKVQSSDDAAAVARASDASLSSAP